MKPDAGFNGRFVEAAVPPYVHQGLFQRQVDNVTLIKSLTVPVLITEGEEDEVADQFNRDLAAFVRQCRR